MGTRLHEENQVVPGKQGPGGSQSVVAVTGRRKRWLENIASRRALGETGIVRREEARGDSLRHLMLTLRPCTSAFDDSGLEMVLRPGSAAAEGVVA
ncbi:hypothetical protein E2C01_081119 [Portunus trituberculatus]|uniref:Uncharacterized protein n=1 Tax=Portunus trituberculatus TaxID=210409 RepID=A0A5B7IX60_PORTR|nr:hypothetical protein [Portunus trituberculatus]